MDQEARQDNYAKRKPDKEIQTQRQKQSYKIKRIFECGVRGRTSEGTMNVYFGRFTD